MYSSSTASKVLTFVPHLADLQALAKPEETSETGDGIDTPGHAHHFSNKGIDPTVLNSSLKKHIAAGAHQGERRLNDFTADPNDRLNPHFADHVKQLVGTSDAAATTSG
jgi:hypothetical protein